MFRWSFIPDRLLVPGVLGMSVGPRSFGALDMINTFLFHSSSAIVTVFSMGGNESDSADYETHMLSAFPT
jgi:hypothetical protein